MESLFYSPVLCSAMDNGDDVDYPALNLKDDAMVPDAK